MWTEKFAWHFYTWPAMWIEPHFKNKSWTQSPIESAAWSFSLIHDVDYYRWIKMSKFKQLIHMYEHKDEALECMQTRLFSIALYIGQYRVH